MQIRNTTSQYGLPSRYLHRILLLCVIGLLIVGSLMGYAPKTVKPTLYMMHKSVGLFTFMCAILFLLWSFVNTKPSFPENMSILELFLAKTVHRLLYICVILMPIFGWLMSSASGHVPTFFNLFSMPALIGKNKLLAGLFSDLHGSFALLLLTLIGVHVIGALKHHFIGKDNVLKRMW